MEKGTGNQVLEAPCVLCERDLAVSAEPLCSRCEKLHFEAMIEVGDDR